LAQVGTKSAQFCDLQVNAAMIDLILWKIENSHSDFEGLAVFFFAKCGFTMQKTAVISLFLFLDFQM